MHPHLHDLLARAHADELRASARAAAPTGRRRRPRRAAGGPRLSPLGAAVTIRYAFPDDARTLQRLAALDSSELPQLPVLVAEIDGELHVALSLKDGTVIADPFHPTVALTELLRARGGQLTGSRPFADPDSAGIGRHVAASVSRAIRRLA
jgi:hypothetical protein